MNDNNKKILSELKDILLKISKENLIIEEKNIFSKKHLSPMYDELKKASIENKKTLGKEINELKNAIEEVAKNRIEEIQNEFLSNIKSEFDPLIPSDFIKSGCLNPIQLVANDIISFFENLSFEIVYDNEITTTDYCFDRLNFKEDHPAKSLSDTFYLSEKELLRVHCTSVTAKMLEKNNKKSEIKVVSFGNVFRKDDDDATHSHQFNQIDFVWLKENISIANLKWLIDGLMKHLFNEKTITRFRLSQFPFTEPSMEVDISCFICSGDGCNLCKKTGWIEILGAGLLHPNVLKSASIDSEKYSAMAAGFGLDRIAMLKYGITDIRHIYENDFRILEQFRGKR